MATFTITDAIMDYNKGRIVLTLDPSTPFTGSVGNIITTQETISEKIIFCYKDRDLKTIIDPFFDAGKGRSQNHDPKLNYPLGTP